MYPTISKKMIAAVLLSGLSFAAVSHAAEEDVTKKDPARWTQPDNTPQLKAATMRKEAAAAYKIALDDCKEHKGAEAAACKRDAKKNYDEEMKEAANLNKMHHKMGHDMAHTMPADK